MVGSSSLSWRLQALLIVFDTEAGEQVEQFREHAEAACRRALELREALGLAPAAEATPEDTRRLHESLGRPVRVERADIRRAYVTHFPERPSLLLSPFRSEPGEVEALSLAWAIGGHLFCRPERIPEPDWERLPDGEAGQVLLRLSGARHAVAMAFARAWLGPVG